MHQIDGHWSDYCLIFFGGSLGKRNALGMGRECENFKTASLCYSFHHTLLRMRAKRPWVPSYF